MPRLALMPIVAAAAALLGPAAGRPALAGQTAATTSAALPVVRAVPQDLPDRIQWRQPSSDLRKVLQNAEIQA